MNEKMKSNLLELVSSTKRKNSELIDMINSEKSETDLWEKTELLRLNVNQIQQVLESNTNK